MKGLDLSHITAPKGAKYQMIGGVKISNVTNRQGKSLRLPEAPSWESIPSTDTIWVKNKKPCPPNTPGAELFPIECIVATRTEKSKDGPVIVPIHADLGLQYGSMDFRAHQVDYIRYCEICNYNISNPNRRTEVTALFERFDPQVNKVKSAARLRAESEATEYINKNWATDAGREQLIKYAKALRIETEDVEPDAIYVDLINAAKGDPDKFMREVESPKTERDATILTAIKAQIIRYNKTARSYEWCDNNATIYNAPTGVTAGQAQARFGEWLEETNVANGTYDLIKERIAGTGK